MLKQTLQEKYEEIKSSPTITQLALIAKDNGKIFSIEKSDSIREFLDIETYGEMGAMDMIASIAFSARKDSKCIGIFCTKYINYVKHGIPLMLDEFIELFGMPIICIDHSYDDMGKELQKSKAVIVKNSFVIVCGRSIDEVATMTKIIEKNMFVFHNAQDYKPLSKTLAKIENFFYTNFYSKQNQQRQWDIERGIVKTKTPIPKSTGIRNDVLSIAKQIFESNKTQGTWGNVAIRIDENTMYCTPKGISYSLLTPDSIVKINYHTVKTIGKGTATSEKGIHAMIMRNHKDAYISIHAHPYYSSIFCATHKTLIVSEKNKHLLGEKVFCSPHELPTTKKLTVESVKAMKNGKAGFMGNHGIIVYGETIEEALTVIEALEEECQQAIFEKQ